MVPRAVTRDMLSSDPLRLLGILRIPGFLDPGACARLRADMEAGDQRAAPVAGLPDSEGVTVDESTRKSKRTEVDADATSLVEGQVEGLTPTLESHFTMELGRAETPQFLTYGVGDFFREHRDAPPGAPIEQMRERRVSVVIFLNAESADPQGANGYSGGSLVFYELLGETSERHGVAVRGETGLLVAFRSEVLHEVTPVTGGRRHTVVTWLPGSGAPAQAG